MPRDGMDKIRKKGGPKEYKSGPRATGPLALYGRLNRLALAAHRLARKSQTSNPQVADASAVLGSELISLANRFRELANGKSH